MSRFIYVHIQQMYYDENKQVRQNFTEIKQFKYIKGLPKGGGEVLPLSLTPVIPELGCHLRPMVRKGKSLLFGHISRIFKKNGGGTATTAENRHLPPKNIFAAIFFCYFSPNQTFLNNLVSNAKSKGIFFGKKKLVSNDSELSNSARNGKKIFWRQMAIFGGRGGTAAVFFKYT